MKYIKDAVYGGVDGILSAFNFLVIMQSAHFPKSLVLVILVLKLLSDGVSLSLSNYTGNAADAEMREALQVETYVDKHDPFIGGLVTLVGFLVVGSLPILIYHFILHDASNIWLTTLVVLCVIFVLGMVKSAAIHKDAHRVVQGGAHFATVGVVGVLASITIGKMMHALVGHRYAV